jgi:hypothetical protein
MLGFCTGADEVQAKLMANSHAPSIVADNFETHKLADP